MSAALDARGLKRVCSECGGRFYDMNKRPIVCPSCQTEFTGEMKVKSRRGRVPAEAAPTKVKDAQVEDQNDNLEIEDEEEDIVSLDDVEDEDDALHTDDEDEDDIADLDSIDDEDLGDLGKDLGDLDAGIDMDDDDDDLEADLGDVKRTGGGDE